jgi:alkylation response protein AidB-like acyl-CoA dehydrogenase
VTLNLLPTEIENDLRATVRDLLVARCDASAVTAMYDGDRSVAASLWSSLATDLGLAGLLVPEEDGGAGATAREAAVVLEELGRACAPAPFLTSSVIATTVLLGSGSALLGELASGERTAALLVPLSLGPDDDLLPTVAVDDAGRLTGRITSVAGALDADVLLALAAGPAGLSLYAVDAERVGTFPVSSLDMSRQLADITLDRTPAELVRADADEAVRDALLVGAALLASEQVGVARWCLDETVAYLKVRKQFGRTVGGFQALKHRLADLFTDVESASAAAQYAAAAVAAGTDVAVAARVAAAYCSDLAVRAAEEAIQLHGGIGMTWEHPAHLYLKRAKADQIALGTAGAHRTALGPLIDLEN